MSQPPNTPPKGALHRVRQAAKRGAYDRESIHAVLDACPIGHVAASLDGQPISIPTAIARLDEHLYLHGSVSSRLYQHIATGAPIAVSCCVVDGLVKARSAMHCSMNYRSAVVFGSAERIEGDALVPLLDRFTERLIPGSAGDFRPHLPKEIKATMLVRLPLDQASVKIRTGGPVEEDGDESLPHWAGVIPLREVRGEPEPSAGLPDGIALPDYAR